MSIAQQNLRAFISTGIGCGAFVAGTAYIGKKKMLPSQALSRKLIHIGCGSLFSLCWPLYSTASPWSPFLAASVPFLASMHFALVGTHTMPDILGLVPAATRSGRSEELLRGPFLYGIVHAVLAATLWRRPESILAIAVLCGGDGLAEVVGTSVASPKLAWNTKKSVAGTAACFVGGTVFGYLMLLLGQYPGSSSVLKIAVCAAVGAAVESLPMPIEGGDNVTVPLSVVLAARTFL